MMDVSTDKIYMIPLTNDSYAFGRTIDKYLFVYDLVVRGDIPTIENICNNSLLFVVYPSVRALKEWKICGEIAKGTLSHKIPNFFMQDVFNPKLCKILHPDSSTSEATPEDCVGLERASVWDKEHIENRISDHYAQKVNETTERLKVKL